MKRIEQMFSMQLKLNNETNGNSWIINNTTKEGRKINWNRCIYMECAELIDSLQWKHWKNINEKENYNNVIVEIVDIWHFIMSAVMAKSGAESVEIAKKAWTEYENKKKTNNNSLIEKAKEILNNCKNNYEKNINKDELFAVAEKIIAMTAFEKAYTATDEKNETFNDLLENFSEREWSKKLINLFIELIEIAKMDLDTLYKEYIAKNVLNKFRQKYGYKEGIYKKIWNGKEDNEIVREILDRNNKITPEALMAELEKIYRAIFAKPPLLKVNEKKELLK